jgi:2,3-bisphosphoglycerate-independent phosphoglycerate mutase
MVSGEASIILEMARRNGAVTILLVLDGLGGFNSRHRSSELTAARTPNLDQLASEGALGLHDPASRGITVGSGAGHLGLFGYDPLQYVIGRGTFTAAGVGFELQPGDVAARANFCTVDKRNIIIDRRAGRLTTDESSQICAILTERIHVEGCEAFFIPERDHAILFVLRGGDLSAELTDTDPQKVGVCPLEMLPKKPEARSTARLITNLLDQVAAVLADRTAANFLILRGFDTRRELPPFPARYQMNALAIAVWPMYIGITRLLGFEAHKVEGDLEEEASALENLLPGHDFTFMHFRDTDTAGEDGDFDRKVAAIERLDAYIPRIINSGVEVLAVTGDHSTPSQLAAHSWHPVPVLLWGGSAPADRLEKFDEDHCRMGSLGRFEARYLMPQILAASGRLAKYGALFCRECIATTRVDVQGGSSACDGTAEGSQYH